MGLLRIMRQVMQQQAGRINSKYTSRSPCVARIMTLPHPHSPLYPHFPTLRPVFSHAQASGYDEPLSLNAETAAVNMPTLKRKFDRDMDQLAGDSAVQRRFLNESCRLLILRWL